MKFHYILNQMMSFLIANSPKLPGMDFIKKQQKQYVSSMLKNPRHRTEQDSAALSDFFLKNYHHNDILEKYCDAGYKLSEKDFWHITHDYQFVAKYAEFLSGDQHLGRQQVDFCVYPKPSRQLAQMVKELLPQYEERALGQWKTNLQGEYFNYMNVQTELLLQYQVYKQFWLKRLDIHDLDDIKGHLENVMQSMLEQKEKDIKEETVARARGNYTALYSPREQYERWYKHSLAQIDGFFGNMVKDFNAFKEDEHYFLAEKKVDQTNPQEDSVVQPVGPAQEGSIKDKFTPQAYQIMESILQQCQELSTSSRLTPEQGFSIDNISTKILPQTVNAYLAIDYQYRDNANDDEKTANALFMEALNNLQVKLLTIKGGIEEEKLVKLKQATYYTRNI